MNSIDTFNGKMATAFRTVSPFAELKLVVFYYLVMHRFMESDLFTDKAKPNIIMFYSHTQ